MSAHPDRLIRLDDSHRILSEKECEAIAQRLYRFAHGEGETRVRLLSWWNGELRWARNRVSMASDRRDIRVSVWRDVGGSNGTASTNQLDDVSLEAVVRAAERIARLRKSHRKPDVEPPLPSLERPRTAIWSDATYNLTTEERGEVARGLVAPAEDKGMLSAGYLEVRGGSMTKLSSLRPAGGPYAPWDMPYVAWTQAQCSMTVRDPEGTGSGWAGLSSYDWGSIDSAALSQRALEKCVASQHPVALEPGRYTVILEAQAVGDLMSVLTGSLHSRGKRYENGPYGPWTLAFDEVLRRWRTKLGLKVADARITISHDPVDPALGILPEPGMEPVTWIDHGVLTNIPYDRDYALTALNANAAVRRPNGYRMSGGETSIEEMIKSTKRGLLVTRFSNIDVLDRDSLLATGLTRDGLWLIENGKVSKAVKNLRFTESPLFVLNSLEQLGPPVPVFRPVKDPYQPLLSPAIVPPLKARDFSFTSLIDAV